MLVVADAATDERLFSLPVDEGSTVTLSYTHNVEKTPVRDVYIVPGTIASHSLVVDGTPINSANSSRTS